MKTTLEDANLRISAVTDDERERWDEYVRRLPQTTLFHRYDFLRTVERFTSGRLRLLVGTDDGAVVGIFPLYVISKGPVRTVFSPPPLMGLPQLGPALSADDETTRVRAEALNKAFVDGCLDWIATRIGPQYAQVQSSDRLSDPRPFQWRGYDVTPQFTYAVDLTDGKDGVMAEFSRDARNNARNHAEVDVRVGGPDAIRRILRRLERRYEEQGRQYPIDASFVLALYDRLPQGRVKPYVATVDGAFAGGIVVLDGDETAYRWQGGMKTETDVPVNDVLDWRIMCDAIERGRERYDLVGANVPSIAEYKAKFNPDLVTYYQAVNGSQSLRIAAAVYRYLG